MGGRAATEAVIQGRCAISVNDPGHPAPPGWTRVPLSAVAELGTGHTPSRKHPEYWIGDVPWIGIRDAGAHHGGMISSTIQHTNELGLANSAARLLPQGTVCLSRTASVGYVVMMGRPMATSQDFVTWTCGDALEPRFLMQALLAEGEDIRRFGEGSTHTTIYFPEVKAFHLDMPSVPEQRRIVAKIDSLSAKSSRARYHLDHIPRLVGKYKEAVLAAAFEGQLTIRERGGSTATWKTSSIGRIAEITSGFGFPKEWQGRQVGDYPFAKVSDISRAVATENGSLTGAANWIEREDLRPLRARPVPTGSVVFAKIGEALRLNRRAITRLPVVLDNNCMALSPHADRVEPEFLFRFMWTIDLNPFAVATAVPSVRRGDVADLPINLPPLLEQREIVRRIETAFAWIDQLASEATSARRLVDRLDQAILAKAFRGELVPQDPSDEPASVLLDRIKAERTTADSPRRGRKKAA